MVIIDSHVHAWARWPYTPAAPDPEKRGSYKNLLYEMDAAGVTAAIIVSAGIGNNGDNNDYVAAAVARYPGRLYQFIDADSRWTETYHRPGAAQRLARLCDRYAPAGVSHYLGPENDGWLRSPEGVAFFSEAAHRGLPLSLAASPSWFEDVCSVADSVPEIPILLNHLCLTTLVPSGRDAVLRDLVNAAIEHPNIVVKASGYYYGSSRPWDYPFRKELQIVRAFYETWGPQRIIWASDFPASATRLTYRQSIEVLREHATFIDPRDLPAILGGTMAARLGVDVQESS